MEEAKDWTISQVSPKTKSWSGSFGEMITYYVRFNETGDETIELNRRPDSAPPKENDRVYGNIIKTEFGRRFKSAKRPKSFGGSRSPEDQRRIEAEWAIGRAYESTTRTDNKISEEDWVLIHDHATRLLEMIDSVIIFTKSEQKEEKQAEELFPEGE